MPNKARPRGVCPTRLALEFGVSRRTVMRRIKAGAIKAVHLGGYVWVIPHEEHRRLVMYGLNAGAGVEG